MLPGIVITRGYNSDGTSDNEVYNMAIDEVTPAPTWTKYTPTRPDTADWFVSAEGAFATGSAFDGVGTGYFVLGDRCIYSHTLSGGVWNGPIGAELWGEEPLALSLACDGVYVYVAAVMADASATITRHKIADGTRDVYVIPNDLIENPSFIAVAWDYANTLYVHLNSWGDTLLRLYAFSLPAQTFIDLGEIGTPSKPSEPVSATFCNGFLHVYNGGFFWRYDPATDVWVVITALEDPHSAGVFTVSSTAMVAWGDDHAGNAVFRYYAYPVDPAVCPMWGVNLDPHAELSDADDTDQRLFVKAEGYSGMEFDIPGDVDEDEDPTGKLHWLTPDGDEIVGNYPAGLFYNGGYNVIPLKLKCDIDLADVVISGIHDLPSDVDLRVSLDNETFTKTVSVDLTADTPIDVYYRIFTPIGGVLGVRYFTARAKVISPVTYAEDAVVFYRLEGVVPGTTFVTDLNVPKFVGEIQIPGAAGCMAPESVYRQIEASYGGKLLAETPEEFREMVDRMLEYLEGTVYAQFLPGRYIIGKVRLHTLDPKYVGRNDTFVDFSFDLVAPDAVFLDFDGGEHHAP